MSRLEELANSLFGEMRDMTPEESKACRESISKIVRTNGRSYDTHITNISYNLYLMRSIGGV